MLKQYKNLKEEKQYLKLVLANFISSFGDRIDNLAIPWIAYEITNDIFWITIITGCSYLPNIILSPIFSVYVERMNKKMVLILSDLLGAITMITLAILYMLSLLNPYNLLLIVFINSSIEAFRSPAGVALVPRILKAENYHVGIALNSSLGNISSLIGYALAGVILALFEPYVAVLVDAFTFIISLIIILVIKYKEDIIKEKEKFNFKSFKNSFVEGLGYLFSNKTIKFVCFCAVFINFLSVALGTYNVVYIKEILNMNETGYVIFSIVMTVGSLLGSIISPMVSQKLSFEKLMKLVFCFNGIVYIAFTIIPTICNFTSYLGFILILMLAFTLSLIVGVVTVSLSVTFMSSIESEYLARCAATFNSMVMSSMPASSFVLVFLASLLTIEQIFLVYGTTSLIIFISLLFSQKKKLNCTTKKLNET